MFDIKVQGGSTCARTPVQAIVDANSYKCITTGVETIAKNQIALYPNPSNSTFNIQSALNAKVKVIDNLGRVMTEFNLNGNSNFGDEFAAGIYHVIVYNDNGVVQTLNVVKE
ncbi:MAG: T9SS type A sorting domain-containing protein [Bacteroidetes bacterium]|nr:T9SS type A sorting domain-containing protein [Bacteroidota bacterium]